MRCRRQKDIDYIGRAIGTRRSRHVGQRGFPIYDIIIIAIFHLSTFMMSVACSPLYQFIFLPRNNITLLLRH